MRPKLRKVLLMQLLKILRQPRECLEAKVLYSHVLFSPTFMFTVCAIELIHSFLYLVSAEPIIEFIAASTSTSVEDNKAETKTRRGRKPKKKDYSMDFQFSKSEVSDGENSLLIGNDDECDEELDLGIDEGDDVSITYSWPPLVCCFGAAHHAFVPSGRPANRLLDYEIHDRMKDALWAPEKFVRAPGGSAGSVAIALSSLGGKVAFMGKLGDDDYGQAMLYYMNVNNVQTRSVRVDSKRATAMSQMKIGKRGRLKMTCIKSSAEDSLSKSEINIDVLKEVKDTKFIVLKRKLLNQVLFRFSMRSVRIWRMWRLQVIFEKKDLWAPCTVYIEPFNLLVVEHNLQYSISAFWQIF